MSKPNQITTIPSAPGQVCENGGVTSYLVASSPEVLSQLLKENEARGIEFNPALYTTPANALNTSKVEFALSGPLPRPRTRQVSRSSTPGSLERHCQSGLRSLPGSGHSTLSRSPAGSSFSLGHLLRRKASFNSSSQVTRPLPLTYSLLIKTQFSRDFVHSIQPRHSSFAPHIYHKIGFCVHLTTLNVFFLYSDVQISFDIWDFLHGTHHICQL